MVIIFTPLGGRNIFRVLPQGSGGRVGVASRVFFRASFNKAAIRKLPKGEKSILNMAMATPPLGEEERHEKNLDKGRDESR